MTHAELAKGLGLSVPTIRKHARKGMPTHSVEAAMRWRDDNLQTFYRKEYRCGGNKGGKVAKPPSHAKAATKPTADDRITDFDLGVEVALCGHIPLNYFQPRLIAACAADAGLKLNGDQAIKLAGCLLYGYMEVFDDPDRSFQIPPDLMHKPGSHSRAELAAEIDASIKTN